MSWEKLIAYLFIIGGVAYASYSGLLYYQKVNVAEEISTPMVNESEIQNLDQQQKQDWIVVPKNQRPQDREIFGQLQIPSLNVQAPIIEGTYEEELAHGIGHYKRSVLPGEKDNAVLSAHRDTIFRRLGELKKGDVLQVRTKQGVFVYKITKTWITDANDRSVIVPHENAVLTLTTCYPFSFIGPAPQRFVVQSELVKRL